MELPLWLITIIITCLTVLSLTYVLQHSLLGIMVGINVTLLIRVILPYQ
ncbi:hypothetical protein [Mucilaginibacter gilvus]|nr:hypothetical protein [Mucilaginibacter gilvus]